MTNTTRAKKLRMVIDLVLNDPMACEVYAYGGEFKGKHYKALWFTRKGVLKCDTLGPQYLTKADANRLIAGYATAKFPLVRVHPEAATNTLDGVLERVTSITDHAQADASH